MSSLVLKKGILVVTAVFPPEPVVSARMAFDVAQKLSKECDVVVVSPRPSRPFGKKFEGSYNFNSFKHIVLNSFTCPQSFPLGRFRESWSFGRATCRYIKKNKNSIGVIYANTWPLFAQKKLCKMACKYNIPLIIHIQDIYPDSFSKKMPSILAKIVQNMLLPIDKYVLQNSSKIIGISPSMIDYLSRSRMVAIDKFILVRNWQNDKVFYNDYNPICTQRRIRKFLFLGSINPTASVETIIVAFAKANIENSSLSIIGTGPNRKKCESLALELGVNVRFGQVDVDDVAKVQSDADILLLPLKKGIAYTATPSKLTAYLLSGRPIIAAIEADSDAGNIISESKCGVIVPSEDIEEMAKAMIELNSLSDLQLNTMGKSGMEYAKQYLTKEYNLNLLCKTINFYM